jgi:hypothetical protein
VSPQIISISKDLVAIRREPGVRLFDDLNDEVRQWMDDRRWVDGRDYQFSTAFAVDFWMFMVSFDDPEKAMLFKLTWGGK